MHTPPSLLLAAITLMSLIHLVGCQPEQKTTPLAADASMRELGRHLVEDIGLCADCHTPRLPNGELDRTRWMQGAPVGFKPMAPMPWVPMAPPLNMIAAYTDEQAVKLFTQGIKPNGQPPLPPMPGYRFTEDEARAVVSYLRALPASTPATNP